MKRGLTPAIIAAVLLTGCADNEPPPRTVSEFVENKILLEAAMVRCSRDRVESKYDQECINAREAVKRIQAREEEVRRAELEERSEAKRRALRRTLEAQAEARRRAAEDVRRREEAEYLAQFGVLPPTGEGGDEELPAGNAPLAVVPKSADPTTGTLSSGGSLPAGDGSNAPIAETVPDEDEDGDSP